MEPLPKLTICSRCKKPKRAGVYEIGKDGQLLDWICLTCFNNEADVVAEVENTRALLRAQKKAPLDKDYTELI